MEIFSKSSLLDWNAIVVVGVGVHCTRLANLQHTNFLFYFPIILSRTRSIHGASLRCTTDASGLQQTAELIEQ